MTDCTVRQFDDKLMLAHGEGFQITWQEHEINAAGGCPELTIGVVFIFFGEFGTVYRHLLQFSIGLVIVSYRVFEGYRHTDVRALCPVPYAVVGKCVVI